MPHVQTGAADLHDRGEARHIPLDGLSGIEREDGEG